MPMSLSTSDMIRTKRLATTLSAPLFPSAFKYKSPEYSGTPANNTSSTVFVISCIDPRFTYAVEEYLLAQLGPTTNYDLFVLAGAAMGGQLTGNGTPIPACSLVSASNSWRETLFDHLQVAISLHNVSKVYIIDHSGCAAYGVCGATDTKAGHKSNFDTLKAAIVAATFYANGTANPSTKTTVFSAGNVTGLYFDVPVGLTTSLLDYTTVAAGVAVGTYTYPATSGANVLVLGCIDPRFSELLSSFLINYKDVQFTYDLFITAGSSLGVNQSYNTDGTQRTDNTTGTAYPQNLLAVTGSGKVGKLGHKWGPSFFDHLAVAVSVHKISEVWVFDHLDCGAYKAIKFGNFALPDLDPEPHVPELQKLQGYIKTRQPSLAFKGFIMDMNGGITKVIDDSTGVKLDLQNLGSSKIRTPASEFVDLKAKGSADYVLTREYSGAAGSTGMGSGFGRQMFRTKLTPIPAVTTELKTKVILKS
jgi:carbonic anhydrase